MEPFKKFHFSLMPQISNLPPKPLLSMKKTGIDPVRVLGIMLGYTRSTYIYETAHRVDNLAPARVFDVR